MESQDLSPVQQMDMGTSRPSLGFPLGTALLLVVIFSLSGIFSCCYHWEKIRSLRASLSSESTDSPSKPASPFPKSEEKHTESLPVIMAGDSVPRFMALPSPCEPRRPEIISIQLQK